MVTRSSKPKYHEIYFDNFFTSTRLLQLLSEKGYITVGTIRENRTNGASKSMIFNQVMKRKTHSIALTIAAMATYLFANGMKTALLTLLAITLLTSPCI